MKNILRFGINGNVLKTIALIAMVIDHIGFYFEPFLNSSVMFVLRYVGRIAMPIFTYLIVQGFFHTKDFKKYILRLFTWAVITQIVVTGLMFVNLKITPEYVAAKHTYVKFNILLAYVISLIALKIIHEETLIKKWDYNKNLSIKILSIVVILIASVFLPIDYSTAAPVMAILFYFVERLKVTFMIKTETVRKSINSVIKTDEYVIIQLFNILLLFISIFITIACTHTHIYSLFAILPLALYNGESGKKSKLIKNFFYVFFPLHHVILYSLAIFMAWKG